MHRQHACRGGRVWWSLSILGSLYSSHWEPTLTTQYSLFPLVLAVCNDPRLRTRDVLRCTLQSLRAGSLRRVIYTLSYMLSYSHIHTYSTYEIHGNRDAEG